MEELSKCKENSNESITNFFQRLETIQSNLLSSINGDGQSQAEISGKRSTVREMTLNRYIYHSNPQISQMLRWKDFTDLNSAFSAAVAEERVINSQKSQTLFCHICKRRNHDTSQCRARVNSQTQRENFSSFNNQIDKTCKYCKNKGHTIEECRKLKFRNQLQHNPKSTPFPTPNKQHLNSRRPPVTNTPLEDRIANLAVFE